MDFQRFGILSVIITSLLLTLGCAKEAESPPVAKQFYDWNQNPEDHGGAECVLSESESDESRPIGIVGGEDVPKNNWLGKGIAFLMQNYRSEDGRNRNSICTASLIDKNILLTAAHCVDKFVEGTESSLSVYFTNKPECENSKGQLGRVKRQVSAVRIHPYWNPNEARMQNRGDLALIRLKDKAPDYYKPLQLASQFVPLSEITPILVAGYGMVNPNYYGEFGGDISLRVTQVQGISPEKKMSLLSLTQAHDAADEEYREFDNTAANEMLYVDQSQGKGICGGDSGGPSLMKTPAGQDVITGVASFVMNPEDPYLLCGYVAAHTSVIYYKDWISTTFEELRNADTQARSPFH